MPGKEKIDFNGSVPRNEAAQYLESIAKGLREGSMLFESGDSSITLEVADDVKIEIAISSDAEKGKSSMDVALAWRARQAEEEVVPAGLLIVPGATPAERAFAE